MSHLVLRTEFIDKLEKGGERERGSERSQRHGVQEGVRNDLEQMIREGRAMRKTHDLSWSQAIMAANTPALFRAAMVDGCTHIGVMASGQVVGVIKNIPSTEMLMGRVIRQANESLGAVSA